MAHIGPDGKLGTMSHLILQSCRKGQEASNETLWFLLRFELLCIHNYEVSFWAAES